MKRTNRKRISARKHDRIRIRKAQRKRQGVIVDCPFANFFLKILRVRIERDLIMVGHGFNPFTTERKTHRFTWLNKDNDFTIKQL